MSDLYPVLLRDVKDYQYGAILHNIVALNRKGDKMNTKKLIIVVNGDKYDPIECDKLRIQFEEDVIRVEVNTINHVIPKEGAPSADGLVAQETPSTFTLQGDDLDAFKLLSEFRAKANSIDKIKGQDATTVTLTSDVFNIQDNTSVQNASFDLTHKEREFLIAGYKVYSCTDPIYEYENENDFKLIETAILYKDIPSEE